MEHTPTVSVPIFNPALRRFELIVDADPCHFGQIANVEGVIHAHGNQFIIQRGHNRDAVHNAVERKLAEITGGNGESAA